MGNCACHEHSAPARVPVTHAGRLTILARSQDPTRTAGIQRRFIADAKRRFVALQREITNAIVRDDIFGLRRPQILTSPGYNAFAFETNPDKVIHFMDWLATEEQAGVLQVVQRGVGGAQPWTNMYVDTAYRQGQRRAVTELVRAGYTTPSGLPLSPTSEAVRGSFLAPVHVETAAMAFQRTFTGLRGITQAMDTQISQVLADGLLNGDNPRQIARVINARVQAIGISRATTLARTEVVRAHHQANIAEYDLAGVEGVGVMAEWKTAGFGVCKRCKAMERRSKIQPFTLEEIRPLIPLHPNCRCVAIPIVNPNPTPVGLS